MTTSAIAAARKRAYELPIDQIDVSDVELFRDNTIWPYFERLRKEDPVHYCADSKYGPYLVDHAGTTTSWRRHQPPSRSPPRPASRSCSTRRTISPCRCSSRWIRRKHDVQRKTVQPIVAPREPREARRQRSANARLPILDCAAARRRRSTGSTGVDRADDADAGDAVRFPVRRAPQAHLLVRRGDRRHGSRRHRRVRGAARRRTARSASTTSPSCGTSGSAPTAGNDLISMLAHGEATREHAAPRSISAT